jgi:hypothetical protein
MSYTGQFHFCFLSPSGLALEAAAPATGKFGSKNPGAERIHNQQSSLESSV